MCSFVSEWLVLPLSLPTPLMLTFTQREPRYGAGYPVTSAGTTSIYKSLTAGFCRFVLAATEHLHRRIAKMGERIRQLEDALAILQAKYSNEPHPLLHDENSITAATPEQEEEMPITEPSSSSAAPDDQVIEAFGTLSMLEHGVSRFFGPTGGTEVSDTRLLFFKQR